MIPYQHPMVAPTAQIAAGYPEMVQQAMAPNSYSMGSQSMMMGAPVMTDSSLMSMMPGMPGMPMPMGPGAMIPGGSLATFDPIQILGKLSAAKLGQDAHYLAKATGCHMENVYTVFAGDDDNPNIDMEDFNRLFYCKEHSTCAQRYFCKPSQREFNMDMSYKKLKYNSLLGTYGTEWIPFIKVYRAYACTCYCCNRPVIEIDHFADGKKTRLGTIVNEWKCCDFSFLIREGTSEVTSFRINGNCCQCPMMCSCRAPCAVCHNATFELLDCRKGGEQQVGQINKVWSGTLKESMSNADEYTVIFPKKSSWKQKILILCCMVFIDYCYFEEGGCQVRNGRRGRGRRR